jgi:protein gp37
MNKTNIEWTNYSWNPITGCLHNCWYCYAKKLFTRFHRSFEPQFHPERLSELKKLKKPAKVFVCSVADIFAKWTKSEWRDAVLNEIKKPEYSHLTFQLLTKDPVYIPKNKNLQLPKNVWIGATITNENELDKMYSLVNNYSGLKFLSFEPLLGPVWFVNDGYLDKISWIIIGKLTGSKKVKLEKEWVEYIIREARARGIPLFLKNNLKWSEKIQEFPKVN